ncbi:MAG TPA: hypothetical protein ENH85_06185 [Candidatus Scalindua sp.]|nr:hypothetical protein [Candidatus Scalindua sp.]
MTNTEKMNTKQENFKRLCEKRMDNALAKISLIGNLAGSQYEKSEEQIEQVNEALSNAVVAVVERLEGTSKDKSHGFILKD